MPRSSQFLLLRGRILANPDAKSFQKGLPMKILSRLSLSGCLAVSVATAAMAQSAPPTSFPPAAYQPEFGTMWTFDAPPLDYWKSRYNFTPAQRWPDHVPPSEVGIPG